METRVGVIGLGYVGLPLACSFGRKMPTIGFDINEKRVAGLQKGHDDNGEVSPQELAAPHLSFTAKPEDLVSADVFIVAVPTPTDKAKRPDLRPLLGASRTVGHVLKMRQEKRPDASRAVVVFESTVYPGCTEEDCVPAIEAASGLKGMVDFTVGYSPERINPGDREHTFETIIKVVSGQDQETLEILSDLYGSVVKAGVHRAPTIKTAEAAKVIENTQRDLNIALMNELSMLFHKMGIDTLDVLEAAGTKWNFLPFRPGLVGGHCIPEDPYYLTHQAEQVGYHPQVILAGRRINDGMGAYVAAETVKLLIKAGRNVKGARVQVLGVTFKENVPDVRNTRVIDIVRELESFGCNVTAWDPVAGDGAIERLGLTPDKRRDEVACIVLAVPHKAVLADQTWRERLPPGGILIDVKGAEANPREGWLYWRL